MAGRDLNKAMANLQKDNRKQAKKGSARAGSKGLLNDPHLNYFYNTQTPGNKIAGAAKPPMAPFPAESESVKAERRKTKAIKTNERYVQKTKDYPKQKMDMYYQLEDMFENAPNTYENTHLYNQNYQKLQTHFKAKRENNKTKLKTNIAAHNLNARTSGKKIGKMFTPSKKVKNSEATLRLAI